MSTPWCGPWRQERTHQRIVSECGGNPLFAIELARQARSEGDALPHSLRELVRDRVDRLPEGAANALRWASVIGQSFATSRLLAVADMPIDDLAAALEVLEHMAEAALSRKVYAEAGEAAAEMVSLSEKLGAGSEAPFASALAALCRLAEGDNTADRILDNAIEVLRTFDAKHRLALCLRWAAEFDIAAGRLARALDRAEQSLALATAINRPSDIALARVAIAAARSAAGDPAHAEAA